MSCNVWVSKARTKLDDHYHSESVSMNANLLYFIIATASTKLDDHYHSESVPMNANLLYFIIATASVYTVCTYTQILRKDIKGLHKININECMMTKYGYNAVHPHWAV